MSRSHIPRRGRGDLPVGVCASTLLALVLAAVPAEIAAFEHVGTVELESGESAVVSAVADPAGEFSYLGTATIPGHVVKFDIANFHRVEVLDMEYNEHSAGPGIIDPAGDFAYFVTGSSIVSKVAKIDLHTFTRVATLELESIGCCVSSAVIDPAGEFAYFHGFPRRIVKVDLNDFEEVGVIELPDGEGTLGAAVIDPAGDFAYFGTARVDLPGKVVKIDLDNFQRVGAIELAADEHGLLTAIIDPAGDFAYFGTAVFQEIGRIVKIDLGNFQRVGAIELAPDDSEIVSAVIDPAGDFAYFGANSLPDQVPGRVVKVDLKTFQRVGAVELKSGEDRPLSAVIDPTGDFAHFATRTAPGRVVRIALERVSPVALEVDASPLLSDGNAVFEPGERVEAAPAWRGNSLSPQWLIGSATDFSGPSGPTYTLVADSAAYGEVEFGEVGDCRDAGSCYALDIDLAGAARPVLHWDAAFQEILTDDVTKSWALHIGDSFTDVVRENPFYRAVETLLHHGVTTGCSELEFCPAVVNTRGQMAVFVLRAREGRDYAPPACIAGEERFADVPATSGFCAWVEDLAARGVVAGCGDGNYCPGDPVTRAQMAVFLLRTLEGASYRPLACAGIFEDVACPSTFADWAEELLNRGVTSGCNQDPLEYCPGGPTTRGQMSVFLSTTFGLALYGP